MFVSSAEHDGVRECVVEGGERLGAIRSVGDDLRDHRVVVGLVTRLPVSTAESVRTPGAGTHASTGPIAGRKPRAGVSA